MMAVVSEFLNYVISLPFLQFSCNVPYNLCQGFSVRSNELVSLVLKDHACYDLKLNYRWCKKNEWIIPKEILQCKPRQIFDCKGSLGLGEMIFHLS